jgi:hypothetical protein
MALGQYVLSFKDFSKETGRTRLNMDALTAGNFVAQNALLDTLQSAILGITLGSLSTDERISQITTVNSTPPTDENAQRERKWLVAYKDTVSEAIYRNEIPTAALTGNLQAGSDEANLAATDMATFVAAFEAVVVSPDENPVEILYIKHVGKRL